MKTKLMTSIAALGAGIAMTLFGGWDRILEIMLIFIIIDYITGVASAFKNKTVNSSTGINGLFKKGAIFLVVILAAQLDKIAGTSNVFRTSTAFFFISNEGLSILENVEELGVRLPDFLSKALIKLRDKQNPQDSRDTSDEKKKKGE